MLLISVSIHPNKQGLEHHLFEGLTPELELLFCERLIQIPANKIAHIDIGEFTQVFNLKQGQFAGLFVPNTAAYNLLFKALRRLHHQNPDIIISENTKSGYYRLELADLKSKTKTFIDTSFFKELNKNQKDVMCQTDTPAFMLPIDWRSVAVGICLGFLIGSIVCSNLYAMLLGALASIICIGISYQEAFTSAYNNCFD